MLDYDYMRIYLFIFYRGPQKATLCGPTRIQPQIQFRLADYAITMVNLQKKKLFL